VKSVGDVDQRIKLYLDDSLLRKADTCGLSYKLIGRLLKVEAIVVAE
jgi:hypothetical protein